MRAGISADIAGLLLVIGLTNPLSTGPDERLRNLLRGIAVAVAVILGIILGIILGVVVVGFVTGVIAYVDKLLG